MEDAEAENANNLWETRHGFRVDLLAAFAYLLGPLSGKCCKTGPCSHWGLTYGSYRAQPSPS